MKINYLDAFSDNYIWTMESEGKIAIVDPGDAKPIHEYIRKTGYVLTDVLITHHHWDHTGGLEEVIEEYKCQAYGPSGGHIKGITDPLHDNENFTILDRYKFRAFSAPGHTNDQLSYFCDETDKPILFSGDTLFYAGCGRLFEGTPEDMLFSMDRYKELPSDTLVYCGHEYTESNLKFAMTVEPHNEEILKALKEVQKSRSINKPSLPSRIDIELKINPFMRCREASIIKAAEKYSKRKLDNTAEILGEIRNWKDNF
ncbi:hydroxyacylglutathione hydrolase [SAR86 cluster bacterium]|nr:hydroxyacylglutathione hydrolase [SAR86 cluster bacterium]